MAKKEAKRLSYCLKHQNRVTDVRCSACLKPICEDCILLTDIGKFCGSECYEKRQQAEERVERLRLEDEAKRGPRLMRKLIGWAIFFCIILAAYIAYPKLPRSVRAPVTKFFHKLQYPDSH